MNHMGIKTRLLPYEYVYWVNINYDITNAIKNCLAYLEFQATQPKGKLIQHDIPVKLWKTLAADIFMLNNKHTFVL